MSKNYSIISTGTGITLCEEATHSPNRMLKHCLRALKANTSLYPYFLLHYINITPFPELELNTGLGYKSYTAESFNIYRSPTESGMKEDSSLIGQSNSVMYSFGSL